MTEEQNRYSWVPLIMLVFVFLVGLYVIVNMAFEADAFPDYSSRSTSRFGTKALYNSFGRLNDVTVERSYKPLGKRSADMKATHFFVHVSPDWLEKGTRSGRLLDWVRKGSRVVVTLNPRPGEASKQLSATEVFGDVTFRYEGIRPDLIQKAEHQTGNVKLPEVLFWGSRSGFEAVPSDWNVVYRHDDQPVVLESKRGDGSLVLCAGSYPLTNHALRNHRSPAFLSWLTGDRRRLIFDETHFGIENRPGVMTIARENGLHWFFLSVILLGGLYVWKSASSLVPPYPASSPAARRDVREADAHSGLTRLLQDNVEASELVDVMFEEWKKDRKNLNLSEEMIEDMKKKFQEARTNQQSASDLVDWYRSASREITYRRF